MFILLTYIFTIIYDLFYALHRHMMTTQTRKQHRLLNIRFYSSGKLRVVES